MVKETIKKVFDDVSDLVYKLINEVPSKNKKRFLKRTKELSVKYNNVFDCRLFL